MFQFVSFLTYLLCELSSFLLSSLFCRKAELVESCKFFRRSILRYNGFASKVWHSSCNESFLLRILTFNISRLRPSSIVCFELKFNEFILTRKVWLVDTVFGLKEYIVRHWLCFKLEILDAEFRTYISSATSFVCLENKGIILSCILIAFLRDEVGLFGNFLVKIASLELFLGGWLLDVSIQAFSCNCYSWLG